MWDFCEGVFTAAPGKDCGDSGGSVPQVLRHGMSLGHCRAQQRYTALGLKGSDWLADGLSVRKNQC